jgi:CHAT domain-containing protein
MKTITRKSSLSIILLSVFLTDITAAFITTKQSIAATPNSALLAEARTLNQQGASLLSVGKAELALESWQKANKLYTQLQDTEGMIGTEINQAQALQSLGFYRQALINLQKVRLDLQKQPNSALKVRGLLSLGNSLRALRRLKKVTGSSDPGSLEVLEESLSIAKTLQDDELINQVKFSTANTLRLLNGSPIQQAANEKKQPEKTYRQQAESLYDEVINSSASALLKVQTQLNLYKLQVADDAAPNVNVFLEKIKKELSVLPASKHTVYAYINLVNEVKKNRDAKTIEKSLLSELGQILVIAINQSRAIKDSRAEAQALGELGSLYEFTGQHADAKILTQKALAISEVLPAPDISYDLYWQLGRVLKATEPNNTEPVISAYKQSIKNLKSLRNDLTSVDSDIQFSFRDSVEPVYREFVEVLLSGNEKNINKNLSTARDLMESLQVAELENYLRQGCLDTYKVQLDKIDQSAAVIYPIILPDRIAVITSLPGQNLKYHSQPKSAKDIESTAETLREEILNSGEEEKTDDKKNKSIQALSNKLYNVLINPLEADLSKSKTKTLVFVLDGVLRNIPMAALYDGKNYLVEKYNIALTPGLQLVQPQNTSSKTSSALLGGVSEKRQNFPALPKVPIELASIGARITNNTILNERFTNNQVSSRLVLDTSPIVHFATHGQFSSNIDNTFILTWDDRLNLNQLSELIQQRAKTGGIDLLVLSACETASGDKRATLGLAGMAIKAGAKSTIASLWKVSDDSTQLLMNDLYQNIASNQFSKAEALSRAQRSLLQNSKYQSPVHWAAFVLVGNWQ